MEPSPCQRRRGSAFVWTAKNWRNTAKCTGVLALIPTIAIRCGLPGLRQFQTIAGLIPRTAGIRKSLTSRHRTRRFLSGDALNLSLKDSRSGRVRVQPLRALRPFFARSFVDSLAHAVVQRDRNKVLQRDCGKRVE